MNIRRRETLNDLQATSRPLFGQRVSFAEAFPELRHVRVQYVEHGDGVGRWNANADRLMTEGTLRPYLDCSNPLCAHGGFYIEGLIRQMVYSHEAEREFSDMCRGNEGSPKGRRVYGKCLNTFKGTVRLEYK